MATALLLDAQPWIERLHQAEHGQKSAIVAAACADLGNISPQGFYRLVNESAVARQRKRRSDAGELSISREEALLVSSYMMSSFRRTGRGICSLKDAIKELRENHTLRLEKINEATGEITQLSESTVARALRAYDLHPEQLNRPMPHTRLRSPRPNWCWQMDASVCVIYYLPAGGAMMREMTEAEFYAGKPQNWQKIEGKMVIRYVMADHRTDMRRLWYVQGAESGNNACEFLIRAMQKPEDPRGMLWGMPKFLMVDPGSAQTGRKFKRLCRRLGIELIINKAGNARAKGTVEQSHNRIELEFEHGLKLLANQIRGVDDLNALALVWQRHKNATEPHSRYNLPRWSAWLAIEPQHLVAPPGYAVCCDLAIKDPVPRQINGDMMISWDGEFYSAAGIPGAKPKESISVCLNPWRSQDGKPEVVAVFEDADGYEIHYPLTYMARDELGQFIDAPTIGIDYQRPADTVLDQNRKEVTKLIANETSIEAAEKKMKQKGFVPLAQFAIDPLKAEREAELPAFIDRGATQHTLAVERVELPMPLTDVLMALRAELGQPLRPDQNAFLRARFAGGATRSQVDALVQQFSDNAAGEVRRAG